MDRRHLIALAPALLAATAANASEKESKEPTGQYVDLSPVGLPIVVDGRLVNYIFASVRLNLSPSADATKLNPTSATPWSGLRTARPSPIPKATSSSIRRG